jgi:hypothetical protein
MKEYRTVDDGRKYVTLRLDIATDKAVKVRAAELGIPKFQLVERACRELLERESQGRAA